MLVVRMALSVKPGSAVGRITQYVRLDFGLEAGESRGGQCYLTL